MVLLGPPGVFALEVKAYTGEYRYRKQDFYRRTRVGWRKMQHNPGKQARAGGGLLHDYIADTLNRRRLGEPRLVWVGPGGLQLQDARSLRLVLRQPGSGDGTAARPASASFGGRSGRAFGSVERVVQYAAVKRMQRIVES